MAGIIKKYVYGKNRLSRSLLDGFELSESGALSTCGDELRVHHAFIGALDGVDSDLQWGRLSFKLQCKGDAVITLRALAANDPYFVRKGVLTKTDDFLLDSEVSSDIKEQFFGAAGGVQHSGAQDILLYELTGRYLYLWFEIDGVCQATITDLCVFVPGENFERTFPAVYRSENDFFKRYLSIFSTMFDSFQETIENLDSFLDPDTTSIPALRHFSTWLGIETEGSLSDSEVMRKLIKAAPELLKLKGTKKAIEKLVGLFVEDPFYVVERNLLTSQQLDCEMYGSTPHDFSILINHDPDEALRACLEFFINQFKPLRSRCRIVFFGKGSGLDGFTFLDFNGTVLQSAPGSLDSGTSLAGMTYLN